MKPALRRAIRRWFWIGVIGFVVLVALSNRWVINSADAYMYTDASLLPETEVGLVLGTSPHLADGKPSPSFFGRIRAAVDLYQQGKVRHLIVSGANPDSTYNEPRRMLQELLKAGIPQKDITMDFAGFRTLDSIQRAQAVWGLSQFTIITQRSHCFRAVFLGKKLGLNVVGYVARMGEQGDDFGPRNPIREIFARPLAVLDLVILKTQPKFLGAPEHLELRPAEPPPTAPGS
ncbi:MAG TPA: ElyC/SanA/YdcF family protein [Nevskiaceae bacterium]|nr:ElyC/SanA/YdcF family protein [Nevskiaceae bacterium]